MYFRAIVNNKPFQTQTLLYCDRKESECQFSIWIKFPISVLDPFVIQRSRKLNPRVTLNIGGEHHDVMWATLEKIPNSRLCKLAHAKTHSDILVK